MIWLASFPRSGNTFFRIVLYEVYGIESSVFHLDTKRPLESNYSDYPVVKTHQLPHQLAPSDKSIPAVYLVRDGRDALVSMAHQRKDLIEQNTGYEENLKDAIIAADGSHFGGWSQNVIRWLDRASMVIKFEDLIDDPIASLEKLRPWLDMPEPQVENLPTFHDLKTKQMKYGSGSAKLTQEKKESRRKKFFRRGVIGSWKDEMPDHLHELYWVLHGDAMRKLGYTEGMLSVSLQRRWQISWSVLVNSSRLNTVKTIARKFLRPFNRLK